MEPERDDTWDGSKKWHGADEGKLVAMQELLGRNALRSDAPYARIWCDLFETAGPSALGGDGGGLQDVEPALAAAEWIHRGFRDPELIRDAQLLGCDAAAAVLTLAAAGLKLERMPEPSARTAAARSLESEERERLRALLERDDTD